jgi:hypothetical protein
MKARAGVNNSVCICAHEVNNGAKTADKTTITLFNNVLSCVINNK